MGNIDYPLSDKLHPFGFVMVFVPALRKRLPTLKNIRTKPTQCKAASSKNLI